MRLDVRNYLKPGEQPLWNEAGKWPMAKERVTKPTKPDPPRGSTVKKHVRPAASRSGMGSCRTVLANSIPSVTWRTAAGLRSRVPHRYYLRPSQRHSLADAPARTRVRVGDDVLAACATGSWRVCGISSTSRYSIGSRALPFASWSVRLEEPPALFGAHSNRRVNSRRTTHGDETDDE